MLMFLTNAALVAATLTGPQTSSCDRACGPTSAAACCDPRDCPPECCRDDCSVRSCDAPREGSCCPVPCCAAPCGTGGCCGR